MLAAALAGRLGEPMEHCAHLSADASIDAHLVVAPPTTPWRRLKVLWTGEPIQTLLCKHCLETLRELIERQPRPSKGEVYAALAELGCTRAEQRRFWRDLRRAA